MRILIENTHPAHVHFFRHAIKKLKNQGHEVAVTCRNNGIIVELLKNFQIDHTILHANGGSRLLMGQRMLWRDWLLWRFCREFKPDVLTGIGGVFAAHVGAILRKPVVVWDDTEHYAISHKITWPFATAIYSPDCYTLPQISKQHFYPGCHELAYLHPNRFTPDKNIVRELGIDPDEKYCIIRFSSWQAGHDIGKRGFEKDLKQEFVQEISRYVRPYITAEGKLEDELKQYQLEIPVHLVHHVMAFSCLNVSEGATMASESAVLGVPAVYINPLKLGYINMWTKYGLVKKALNAAEALKASKEFLESGISGRQTKKIRDEIIRSKIDVTELIISVINQYSRSV